MIDVKIAELQSAITIPGTKVIGAMTLSEVKFSGVKLTFGPKDGVLYIRQGAHWAATPITNVKFMLFTPTENNE